MTHANVFICVYFVLGFSDFGMASVIVQSTTQIPKSKCESNEEINTCPVDCAYDYCPTSWKEPNMNNCIRPKECAPPTCKCVFNHRRDENGSCIPTVKCPPFPCPRLNEVFDPCPPYCPSDDCSQATPQGTCPYPGFFLTIYCVPSCRCKKGYWRKRGVCVTYDRCMTQELSEGFI